MASLFHSFRPRAARRLLTGITGVLAVSLAFSGWATASNVAVAATTAKPLRYVLAAPSWEPTWSYNEYSPDFIGSLDGLALLPLAVAKPPTMHDYVPELATSWHAQGSQLVVKLRADATWQNGAPVTSTDVIDSLLLGATTGATASVFSEITGLSAPTRHEVVFDVAKAAPLAQLEQNVLAQTPAPASQYGKFMSHGLKAAVLQYFGQGATAAPSGLMAQTSKQLLAFQPSRLIGDGPFRLGAVNTSEAELVKSQRYWGASRVHVPGIDLLVASSGSAIEPLMLHGQADFAGAAAMAAIASQWIHTPNAHYVAPPGYSEFSLCFNSRIYPLNLVKVRQALAYVIQRNLVNETGYPDLSYVPEKSVRYPVGVYYKLLDRYLTPAQLQKLNPYKHDTLKATKILTSLGFHKSSSGWLLPNGKPFTISAYAAQGLYPLIQQTQSATNQLTAFGIKSTASAVGTASWSAYQAEGHFDMAYCTSSGTTLDPLNELSSLLAGLNFTSPSDPGIGFGPTAKVPGLGTVNVAKTIQAEARTVPPGPDMDRLVWDWARLVNEQVPYLGFGDRLYPVEYSTSRYTHWPKASSPLWKLAGLAIGQALGLMIEDGYVRPVKTK